MRRSRWNAGPRRDTLKVVLGVDHDGKAMAELYPDIDPYEHGMANPSEFAWEFPGHRIQ